MRSPSDVLRDLELDRQQREAEIRLIENLKARADNDHERNMLKRTLVLLAYAHIEGFCKFALLAYVAAINSARMPCGDAAVPLVAATLTRVFSALREVNSKHPMFARSLPNDQELHLSAREQRFIESYEEVLDMVVDVPDQVVDTRSNLKAVLLKRNLFQLGLEYAVVEPHSGSLNRLLGVRNAIAHGDTFKIPKEAELEEYLTAGFAIMGVVQGEVYDALERGAYQRSPGH